MAEPEDDNRHLTSALDGVETAASSVLLMLVVVVVVAATAGLILLIWNAASSFGGTEWFFVGIGYLMVIGWAMGQTTAILRRRRRAREPDDHFEIPLPKIDAGPGGVSFQWGSPPEASPDKKGAWTWSFQSAPVSSTMTFKVDESQLAAAQAAADSGRDWDDVCQLVNPQYSNLGRIEQELYQRAIRMAVEERRRRQT